MSFDLDLVRKVIISLVNIEPDGIPTDKLNCEFKKQEGYNIPFAALGYGNLLDFLKNELKANVRVSEVCDRFVIHPIANENSGHILKLRQDPKKRVPQKVMAPAPALAPGKRSPTMPELVEYKPFVDPIVNNGVYSYNTKQQVFHLFHSL